MEINNPLRDGMYGFMMALEAQKAAAQAIRPDDPEAQKQLLATASQDKDTRELPQAVTGAEHAVDLMV